MMGSSGHRWSLTWTNALRAGVAGIGLAVLAIGGTHPAHAAGEKELLAPLRPFACRCLSGSPTSLLTDPNTKAEPTA